MRVVPQAPIRTVPQAPVNMVLDWDGTVTVRDTFWMMLERFGDRDVFESMESALGTTHSYREVMETEIATVTAPLDEVIAYLVSEVEVRTGFRELAERCRPLVLSAGFVETIQAILARERVDVEVVANRVDPRPDGWRMLWNDAAPCPECGELCKRRALPAGRPLVYVGDGYSDRCAALAADRVFARRALAPYLDAEGVAYEPFETFFDVVAAL
jgi:2-hydroxy-3-keto-5-methylthiopentenyl-1-phosphate phosphatase